MNYKIAFIFSILAIATLLPVDAQCAMCRAVLESEESGKAAEGINNGIMYLMVFPYLLVGGIGYMVYRNRQKDKQKEQN